MITRNKQLIAEYKSAIKAADLWAKKEIKKYHVPPWTYATANQAGQKLAKHFKVNENIVLLGTILMDIKLGEALSKNKLNQHVAMSLASAIEFLTKFNLPVADKKKILDGVKYHHGAKKYPSLESEIITNSDCYKFLLLKNIQAYFKTLANREMTKPEALKQVQYKFDEKKNALSLAYCKKDLQSEIKKIKDYLKKYE